MARVLILDDEPDVLEVLAAMLEAGGHTVARAMPGAGVWDALGDAALELVITDLNMPELGGREVARWVGQHRPGLPVVAISGDTGASDGDFAMVIGKPVRRARLLETVAQVLSRPR